MAKLKVVYENRGFQNRWEAEYMFVDIGSKPVCHVCGGNVSVIKEYNIRRHYKMKHEDKYKDLNIEQKLQKVKELKKSLVSQQTMFTKAKS